MALSLPLPSSFLKLPNTLAELSYVFILKVKLKVWHPDKGDGNRTLELTDTGFDVLTTTFGKYIDGGEIIHMITSGKNILVLRISKQKQQQKKNSASKLYVNCIGLSFSLLLFCLHLTVTLGGGSWEAKSICKN